MSAAAIGVATTLQNRVVGALGSAQNLLPAPELNSALLQAGATGIATNVLDQLKQGQEKLTEITTNIGTILQEQLDIAEEQQRRERDRSGQFTPGGAVQGTTLNADGVSEGLEEGGFNLGNLLSAGLGTIFGAGGVLATGAALRFAKGLGKGLLKGGFYASMASFLAKPIIDFVEEGVLKFDIPESEEKKMEQAIITAVGLAGIFGPKGAIIGLLGIGLKGVYDVLTDPEKDFKDLTATEIASLGIGTLGTGIIFRESIKKGLKAVGFNTARLATIGGLVAAPPFIIAGGLAIAAGAGAYLLAQKVNDMEDLTLDHLTKLLTMTQEEFEMQLKNQEASFLERHARGLKLLFSGPEALTQGGQNVVGSKAALDDVKFEGGQVSAEQKPVIIEMAEKYSRLSQKDLMDIMMDKQGLEDLLTVSENLRAIAVRGGLGEDSKRVAIDMLKLGDKIKRAAGTLLDRNIVKGHLKQQLERVDAGDLGVTSQQGSVDILEKIGVADQSLLNLDSQLKAANAALTQAKADVLVAQKDRSPNALANLRDANRAFSNALALVNRLEDDIAQVETRKKFLFTQMDIQFDDLKEMFSPEELKALIKSSMMTGSQQIDAAMREFRNIEANPHLINAPVNTDVKNVNNAGDNVYVNGQSNHNLDAHLPIHPAVTR